MTDFDCIEFGYNSADETINFGTRCLADGDNLYEACTLATLQCSEQTKRKSNPYINTVIHDGCIFFSVDTSMRIFKDKQCSDVIFNAGFDAIVDSFSLSVGGQYLLICLRNGIVHLVDCNNEFKCVFSQTCDRDDAGDRFFINSFLYSDYFLIVTKTGQIYKLLFKHNFEIDLVYEFHQKTEIAGFQYPFLLISGPRLSVLDLENNNVATLEYKNFKKLFPLTHMFLALDFEGNLYRICTITLLIHPVNNSLLYKDMEILSDSNQKQVIVVTEDESRQNFIQLLSYPDLNKLYSLKVSNEIHLIKSESLSDELLYISKITNGNVVSELRFHVVYETDAEQRLQRLLRKHKYEEAEKFATHFNLDKGLINKAKASEIIEKSICNTKDVDDLISLLNIIEDDVFKLQCCLDVESFCNKFEDVRKILKYGCNLQLKNKEKRLAAEDLQKSVTYLMYRFDTFLSIHRGVDEGIQAWLQFSGCNLIDEVKTLLRNYKMDEAKIIYCRLDELTCEKFTESDISDILSILNNISIATYEPFLPVFIPITLSILPSTLPLFVKWTHSKVFYLEKRAKSDFPLNAIRFTENIVSLMRVGESIDISFQRQCVLHRDSLHELSILLSTLKTLKTLRDEYRISVPVNGFLAGPENVVRLLLNIEICPEDYDAFLKKFLCKFMIENHMKPNEILLGEIMDLMKYEERYWMNIIGSILNCISSVRVKLEAVKIILGFATVPWSDTVRAIANDSLKYSHALTCEIRDLIKDEPMQVVLRKPKYKIKERQIRNVDDLKFFSRRIIYCNEPSMVGDVYELCRRPEHRAVANVLLISHFIRTGCLEKALELLDDNTPEEISKCARELALMIETIVNEIRLSDQLRNNYYNAARSIFKRLNDLATDEFEKECNERNLELIGNVYLLKKNFGIDTNTYFLRRNKDAVVDEILEDVRKEVETGAKTIDDVFAICYKLATSVTVDGDEILMRFCRISGDYIVIVKTAQKLYDSETSSKNLVLMVVLLLKYVGTYKLKLSDSSLLDSESSALLSENDNIVDDDVFHKGLQLAEILISKAMYKARPEDVSACIEVARWVSASFYFTRNQNLELKKILFGDVDCSASIIPGFLTFSTIKNVFNAFCRLVANWKNPNNYFLTYYNSDTLNEDEFFNELKTLLPILENLNKEGQHLSCYKLIEIVLRSLWENPNPNPKILTFLNDVLKKRCIPRVLSSILCNSVIDSDLLYNLLLSCDREDSFKFIMTSLRMYKRHPRKFSCISQIGLRYWKYCKVTNGVSEMTNALVTVKWWKKFETKKLDYDYFFKIKSEDRFELLINSDCLDMKSVKEYCEDYNLDPIVSYKFFFKKIFQNWKPQYEIKTEVNRRHLIIKNSEDDLLNKCQELMETLDGRQIGNIINGMWDSINTYYYEVFIAMLNILSKVESTNDHSAKLAMLCFLKNYQRVSKPSEAEIEYWYTTFPDTQSLDVLSEFRLSFTPFLFTKQIFNIIRPEINLKTYQVWFKAIDILKPYLNRNEICSFVVKDVVASGILSKEATDSWVLYPKHEDLLREIDDCVTHISDLELVTSVVYHLMTHIPPGADQVNAARLCYKYAVQYREMNPGSGNVEKAVTKVEKKYYTYCAIHILHVHQLAEKKYMNLLSNPKELILALYLDERILRKSVEVDFQCPDINKATEALAELFDLDIKKIRLNLVNTWLGDNSNSHIDLDASMVYNDGTCGDDNSLNRIAYVCCAGELKYWQTQLLQKGLDSELEEQKSVHCKAGALKVFAMISDVETIVELTGLSYDEFTNFIDKLTIVSNLQYLGIGLEVQALDQYYKKELLNRLVQRAGNILSIKTMALICMTYQIYDVKYWEFIVNSTIKFSLYGELKTYINFLNKVKYQNKTFYINAWQKLIDYSFSHLNNPQLLDQLLLNSFLTIQSCPVLYSLNFENAFRKCMDRDKAEFAAVLLQYLDGKRRDEYVKEIRNSNKDLVASLNNLDRSGLWGITHVKDMLANR